MTIMESTLAGAMETAIRTRVTIDSSAQAALDRLAGKRIQLNISDQHVAVASEDGHAYVRAERLKENDFELTGSVTSVGQALCANDASHVAITGDEVILEELQHIFNPKLDTSELLDKGRAAGEAGVHAARSAIEGLMKHFSRNSENAEQTVDLHKKIADLEAAVDELRTRLDALSKP